MIKIKHLNRLLVFVFLSLSLPIASQAANNNQNVSSYPVVHIINSAGYDIKGTITYDSALCSNESYVVGSYASWSSQSRGVCLVSEITATGIDSGDSGHSYESPGTSYSQFVVYRDESGKPSVTRETY
ncbi:hypothetical protein AVI51_15945 (plasmid) [Piscirickettsia salmonis]|uniref:Uncharacterized protein n=2 Tax=Piscirickettsia salmonis TaxID=1238 RepID=A0A9Q5VBY0_PISSA|nr:hypothetical protein [Piscirickettsia salmonis]APS46144.1 hypothetical protein AVI48_17250 [Piscirickettsia salmonis]APS49093.1 hypothetical protein AVI49_15605 [Piscirickettsia salmonis]APS52446.1 hypothetical protein AVI50_16510 [Piscirickettsia salmonis]APS55597.1 hypothetical protein AVI51_15945 [Piscirickettsia salmonis]APS58857.1 hypothetical protein AVI52_16540 [Piscirickettsia salmonis]